VPANNLGGVFKESDPRRKTKWRAEKVVYLPAGGKKRIKVRAMTREGALAELARKEKAVLRANPAADKLTLEKFLDRWLTDIEATVKPGTLKEYRQVVDNHIVPRIGMIRLPDVRPIHVQTMLTEILAGESTKARNGKKAPMFATANNARRYLKQAFRHAERLELLHVNPLRNIEPIKRPKVKRGVWQPHEISVFLESSRTALNSPSFPVMFYLAFFTGLRKGELMALHWSSVTDTHIVVEHSYEREAPGRIGPPKNEEAYRSVPIGPDVRRVLEEQRRRTGKFELVFATRNGRIMEDGNVNRAWRTAYAQAVATLPSLRYITFHGTRRCAATYWARKGYSPKLIQTLLGHATPHLALEVYNEVLEEQMEGAYLDEADVLSGRTKGRRQTGTGQDETARQPESEAGDMSDGNGAE
jgi:integrase